MALVKCKECGNQVSTKAKVCPQCGAKPAKQVGVIGWIFVLVIVLPIAWSIGSNIGGTAPKDASTNLNSTSSAGGSAEETEDKIKWVRSEYKDDMTDKVAVIMSIRSKNATQFEFPYKKPGGSALWIKLRNNGGKLDAFLTIDRGQMLCSYSGCSFNLRVGDAPAQKWTGLQSSTNDSDMMFVRDAKQFESIVKSGKRIRIGIEFYQAGERVFEFDPSGYPGF